MHRTGSRLPTVEQSSDATSLSHTLRAEMEPRNTWRGQKKRKNEKTKNEKKGQGERQRDTIVKKTFHEQYWWLLAVLSSRTESCMVTLHGYATNL